MNIIYFISNWNKDRAKTWSGTCLGLFNSLKKFFILEDIDISNIKMPLYQRILNKLRLYVPDMELGKIKKIRKIIEKKSSFYDTGVIFQFSEICRPCKNLKSYIYQDLSVSYLSYLCENNDPILKYSGYGNNDLISLKKRAAFQLDYYNTCTGIFTMGKWLEKDLVERCHIPQNKVHSVGGGVNLDLSLIKNVPKFSNKILFVGRDFKRKGGFLLIEAFKILKEKKQDLELHIAGPNKNPIEYNINGYYYYGDINHKELSELFNKCDIFCMPSYFEAYGLVFIEALTYGLPCIGRNAFEMPYFIEDGKTGYLLNNDSPIELSELIEKILNDDKIRQNVINNRDYYIKEYSWDQVAKRIHNIISL